MASMPRPANIIIGGLLLSVPALLVALALPRLMQGVRAEPFHSVVGSAQLGQHLSPSTYRAAADALAGAPADDGESLSQRAQVLVLSDGNNPATLVQARALAEDALRAEPSNPDAWLVLCQIDARQSPSAAVGCLDNAFAIAPYDWYTAERRMLLTAQEWPYLSEHVRDKAVSVVLPMWNVVWPISNYTQRGTLYELSFTENGRQLLRAGFAGHRSDLRDFNRYIIQTNTYGQ
jgi:hypothetical protein